MHLNRRSTKAIASRGDRLALHVAVNLKIEVEREAIATFIGLERRRTSTVGTPMTACGFEADVAVGRQHLRS
jgi:hypothetical protein